MMNKKAIAAFAAGATLLAGFAMATPAFAADKTEAPKKEAEKKLTPLEEKQAAVTAAEAALKTAKDKATTAAATKKTADETWKAAKDNVAQIKGVEEKDGVYVKKDGGKELEKTADEKARTEFLNKQAAAKAADEAATKAEEAVKTAEANLATAQAALRDYKPEAPKAEVSESTLKAALVKTSADFDEAKGKLEKAYSKYEAAYFDVDAAEAKANDAEAAYKNYVHSHKDMTKAEKVEAALLAKASRDASKELTDATTARDNAKVEFGKALRETHDVFWAKYAGAYKAAKAKNAELVAGYALPSDVEPVAANYVPGVSHVTPGSVKPGQAGKPGAAKPGQAGKAGQAGANGAAAGSKTEVENKKDKDKRGNTHTGTGVGVTLTALAATMLAGMGAAVRKARH